MKKMSIVRRRRTAVLWSAAVAGILAMPVHLGAKVAPTELGSPIRLSSNENAFGYTPKAKEAMIAALDSGSYYNRNEVEKLIELCAVKEGVPSNHIMTTAGSGPLLMMTALAFAEPGANVVTTEMGYTQLIRKFEARGGDLKFAPLSDEMGYDFEALGAEIDDNTKIVYICNPNNPTGVLADPIELKKFVLSVPPEILVFVDEAYLELADSNFALNTCASLVQVRENLIVTRTFSKGYGMAGFRIGYAVANPVVFEAIKDFHMGVPSFLAAIAAQEAIKDQVHLNKNIKQYQAVRRYVCEAFDQMGITYAKPQGAFVYFNCGIKEDVLQEAMLENGIRITGSRASGVEEGAFDDWARVSIGTKDQMDLFLLTLETLKTPVEMSSS